MNVQCEYKHGFVHVHTCACVGDWFLFFLYSTHIKQCQWIIICVEDVIKDFNGLHSDILPSDDVPVTHPC